MEKPSETLWRRVFFKAVFAKSAKAVISILSEEVNKKLVRKKIRPPGAQAEEIDFLVQCTRCDSCIEACPEGVIQKLDASHQGPLFLTPYMNYENGGCRWCEDFPCIEACPTPALRWNEEKVPPRPVAQLVVRLDHCLVTQGQYCDYCKKACPSTIEPALTLEPQKPPRIDFEKCVGCGECAYLCVSPTGPVFTLKPL